MSNTINNLSLQTQLLAIYNEYPSIFSYENVSVCSKVYYPISLVDVLIEEDVRQAFSPLEKIIIELVKSGCQSIEDLVQAVGLPALYVKSVLQELEATGIIYNFVLTSKGEFGHSNHAKDTTSVYKQRLQFDPILHQLLTEKEINEKYLLPIQHTNSGATHFLPQSHIIQDELNILFSTEQDDIQVSKKRIKEVLSVKTYYVESIALLFNLIPHPFIFFPNDEGVCISLFTISDANLNYYKGDNSKIFTLNRKQYYELWMYVKQIKDEMKLKQDNHILRRQIKLKVSQYIQFCKEEHTLFTDSGLSLVFDFIGPFEFNKKHFEAIQSLEWSSRHIPFLALEDDGDYNNFIAYSECYNRIVYDVSKLMFELTQILTGDTQLFAILANYLLEKEEKLITIALLYEALIVIQTNHLNSSIKITK